ncbi:MAG: RagB/SusD family nutrient uptake outer membrane protein [Prevotella sp.]|nr:RagB/SusD family nutrient uptake outer membrane protein [Prevotella sp.]
MAKYYSYTPAFLIAVCLSLTLGSCLDEDPRDRVTEEEAFDNTTHLYLNTIANIYGYIGGNSDSQGLQGTSRGVYDLCTFTTDEAIIPTRGGDWYDGGLWLDLYTHNFNVGPVNDTWYYLYKVIVKCNKAINRLEEATNTIITPAQLATLEAEARAIRAMYYYYLLDLYGSVPYVQTATTDLNEAKQISRSTLFKNIWEELTQALPHLANERSNVEGDYYGRVTRHVAYFILAKMALNAEIWTDDNWTDDIHPDGKDITLICEDEPLNAWEACMYWCDKLTDAGYRLEEDYTSNFAVNNENSRENIFTIPMDKNLYSNIYVNLFRSRHWNHGDAYGMASENGPSATISAVRTYGYGTEQVDPRFWFNLWAETVKVDDQLVILYSKEPLYYQPLVMELDLTGHRYMKTAGARIKKYEVDRTAYSDGLLQDNDIVLFRYGDVLLMKSEAKVRNNDNGDYELNVVRNRVGAPWRKATLENLLAERLMELHWEGWRRQDLIRFDRFHRSYDLRQQNQDEEDRHTIVFPIPPGAIALNPNLMQNPGY